MAMRCVVVVALLAVANSVKLQEHSLLANIENEDSSKETPIQRVVKLLREMKAQLDHEVANDAELYDKMVCWCETNDKEKTKAIADAEATMTELETEIQSRAAREGQLSTQIQAKKEEIAENKQSLKKATALREKEHAEFNDEEKEKIQCITQLKNAVTILSKHNAGLIQMTPAVEQSLAAVVHWVTLKHEELQAMGAEHASLRGGKSTVASLLSVAQRTGTKDSVDATLLKALNVHASTVDIPVEFGSRILERAASQGAALVQTNQPYYQSYASQSGQIFGILKQMKEEFEGDLSQAQKDEVKAQEEFVELRAALTKAIEAGAAKLDEMEEEFATNTKALSDAKEDYEATKEQRGADVEFLRNLKLKCQDLDRQYEKRSKARAAEVKAVAETIGILTADESRTLFNKKMGDDAASFLQEKSASSAEMRARSRAAAVLLQAARKQMPDMDSYQIYKPSDNKPHEQLAALAVSVQLDAFTKVKKAIDDMVADLKAQQAAEVEKKATCNGELDENEKMTYTTEEALADLQDKIAGLEALIEKLTDEIAAAKKEIADMEVAVKSASETREKENAEFQEEVNDQRMMQAILKKALDRMAKVYETQKRGAGLVQQEPPVKFQPYSQSAGASPVMGLLEQIIEDSKAVETDAVDGEKEAQAAYEEFVNNANASINALNNAIQAKSDNIAEAHKEKAEAESEEKNTQERLDDLHQVNADLHAECDFVLKNFDVRQKARLQEIEALQNAKAYLSGQMDDQ